MLAASRRALHTSTKYYSTLVPNYKQIPGLFLGKEFTSKQEQQRIFTEIADLFVTFRKHAQEAQAKSASIPQASKLHNLPSSEAFWALEVPVHGAREPLKVEYFAKYGEDGHELAYIRGRQKGNNNLPPFAWSMAQKINEAIGNSGGKMGEKHANAGAEGMIWKLTLNYYTSSKLVKGKRAGFPFHTDIQANGDETFIVGFGNPAKMEFVRHAENEKSEQVYSGLGIIENTKRESAGNEKSVENDKREKNREIQRKEIIEVEAQAGELIGLTGEVRNEWLHRVVPEESESDRASMVLGCRPL